MSNYVLALIASYIAAVESAAAELKAHLCSTSVLETIHQNRHLREGAIDATSTYVFHGVGCRFTTGKRTLEFDFGPNGFAARENPTACARENQTSAGS